MKIHTYTCDLCHNRFYRLHKLPKRIRKIKCWWCINELKQMKRYLEKYNYNQQEEAENLGNKNDLAI